MKKVMMNASVASMIYKFNRNNIEILQNMGCEVTVACNFGDENPISQEEIADFRKMLNAKNIRVIETSCPRSMFAVKKMWAAYKQLKAAADTENYDLVHTQSPIGGVVCRLAFRKARKNGTKVIYQAHGFHFYKGAPLVNWLVFYPVEKLCSKFTDLLLTINKEDDAIAEKKFHAKRSGYVPGVGLDLSRFSYSEKSRNLKRCELGVGKTDTLLFSVGELNKNKNHEVVIRALAQLKKRMSLSGIKYFICGKGGNKAFLEKLIEKFGLKENVKLLGFRTDVSEIYQAADLFLFPSLREGLPVALMEAMCCGLPVVCSSIRGNTDLVDQNGGVLFSPRSVQACRNAIEKMLNADTQAMRIYNQEKIRDFSESHVISLMKDIYRGELG